jgi:hydrogenase-4 component F
LNALVLVCILPLLIALLGLIRQTARWLPGFTAAVMPGQLALVLWVAAHWQAPSGDIGLDGVGAAFLVITTLVTTAALIHAALLLPAERSADPAITDRQLGLFYTLTGAFLISMYGVLLSQNLGILWIAMETTTLISAPLVFYHRSRHALEASWKYLLLCSVGIAFALFGTVLLVAAQHEHTATLRWHALLAHAQSLDPRLLRLGFIFCLLGYGTKAGLFPLHNWLPDAHSEAPAPASAMLSGALLNCALVAIWRLSQVMHAAGQGDLVRQLLVPAGAITVLAAGVLLLRQHDLKRMWAYSSVEHVGLLTLAIGIGATPIFLLHALNHSLVKVALFLLAGSILHHYGTKHLHKLGGLLRTVPVWGVLVAAAGFAIAGSPPFGTFISEWLLLRDTFAAGEYLAVGVVCVGLTITFVAIMTHLGRLLFGKAAAVAHPAPTPAWSFVPAALLGLALLTGLVLTPQALSVLTRLAEGLR